MREILGRGDCEHHKRAPFHRLAEFLIANAIRLRCELLVIGRQLHPVRELAIRPRLKPKLFYRCSDVLRLGKALRHQT
jgi:hypothetical protein